MRHPLLALTLATLLSHASAFGMILLDDVMDPILQRNTGVANLTLNQKRTLEAWLNQNFVLKKDCNENGEMALAAQPDIYLSINLNNGKQLQLSDGSLWNVDPDDVATASAWITPFPIQVIPNKTNSDYPFLLVNKNDRTLVKAAKATSPPPSVAPATP